MGLLDSPRKPARLVTCTLAADVTQRATVLEHPRGAAEGEGDATYTASNLIGIGAAEFVPAAIRFNQVHFKIACSNPARDITCKVFLLDALDGFDMTTITPIHTEVIPAASFPKTLAYNTITLSKTLSVPGLKFVVVMFLSTAALELSCARWTTQHADEDRHAFLVVTNTSPDNASLTATGSGYYQAGLELTGPEVINKSTVAAYTHGRSPTEEAGNATYWATSMKVLGFYETLAEDTIFDAVEAPVWCNNSSRDVKLLIFDRASAATFVPDQAPPIYEATIPAAKFPHAQLTNRFELGQALTVAAGRCLFILFYNAAQTSTELRITRWNADTTDPARHAFVLGTDVSAECTLSNTGLGYWASTFKLTYEEPQPITLETGLSALPAGQVAFEPGTTGLAAQTVQAALEELNANGGGGGGVAAGDVVYDPSSSGLSSTNAQDALDELATTRSPRIILPGEISAVVGDKLQVFVRSIIEAQNPYNQPYALDCAIGKAYPRYFEVTPIVGDVGAKTLTVEVLDLNGDVIRQATSTIQVVNPSGAPASNKNILCVGDSLTAGGQWPKELQRRLCQSGGSPAGLNYGNLTFIGNYVDGAAKWVGYGGWAWSTFIGTGATGYWVTTTHDKDSSDQHSHWEDGAGREWWLEGIEAGQLKFVPYGHSSAMPAAPGSLTWVSGGTHQNAVNYTAIAAEPGTPFWDAGASEFSFEAFCTEYGFSGIDALYVLLGWNGLATPNKAAVGDHASAIADATTFLNKLHAEYPDAVARVMGIQVPSLNGGLGANYGATGGSANFYKLLRSVHGYNLALQNLCEDAAFSGWCRYIGVAAQFDSENNMPATATAVNSRSATTELLGTNGVHPSTEGYNQIADAAYRDLVRTFCS